MTNAEKQIRGIIIVTLPISLFLPGYRTCFSSNSVIGYISYPFIGFSRNCTECSIGEMLLILMFAAPRLAGFFIVISNVFIAVKKTRNLQWMNIILVVLYIFWFLLFLYNQFLDDFKIAGSAPRYGIWVYSFLILLAGLAEIDFLIRDRKKEIQTEEVSLEI